MKEELFSIIDIAAPLHKKHLVQKDEKSIMVDVKRMYFWTTHLKGKKVGRIDMATEQFVEIGKTIPIKRMIKKHKKIMTNENIVNVKFLKTNIK